MQRISLHQSDLRIRDVVHNFPLFVCFLSASIRSFLLPINIFFVYRVLSGFPRIVDMAKPLSLMEIFKTSPK